MPSPAPQQIRGLVITGEIESASAFVRESLQARLETLREQRLKVEFEAAARDPEFLADVDEVLSDFAVADIETAEFIP